MRIISYISSDAPWGGCRIPQSWKMYYKDAQGQWQPVSGADKYGVEKGIANFHLHAHFVHFRNQTF